MTTLTTAILKRVRGRGRGSVFCAKDFLDLGTRAAVDQVLCRLSRKRTIRRLGRGLYDYPRVHPKLGVLTPTPAAIAQAVAKKTNSRIQPSGAHAANRLGLSTQVPAHLVYLTDGNSKQIQVGNQTIELRHAAPRFMTGAGKSGAAVIQALRYLGRNRVYLSDQNIDPAIAHKLKRALSNTDKATLKRAALNGPDWVRPVVTAVIR